MKSSATSSFSCSKRVANNTPLAPLKGGIGVATSLKWARIRLIGMLFSILNASHSTLLIADEGRPLVFSSVIVQSKSNGNWSNPNTWAGAKVPKQGDHVLINLGHTITYDLVSQEAIRLIHVRGKLVFSRAQNTQLDAGMIILQNSETVDENFHCSVRHDAVYLGEPRPTLEVGAPMNPMPRNITARIRLVDFADMRDDCGPGIINYGGRMDFHGAPLNHTWLKLGQTANAGATTITLVDSVNWKVGDRIIVTGTYKFSSFKGEGDSFRGKDKANTEEFLIKAINGKVITLNAPLQNTHLGTGEFRAEVANLSRNVIIESKDPNGVRGHTLYHYNSRGSISYAEFAHLGKEDVLARYPIHFHVLNDSHRGASVIGASIWDSHNRFLTIHGTNYLVVRDCVGYKSVGHGYFMEDATEVFNFLDHNLAVLGYTHDKLPNQALQYDENAGAGFWWANGFNALQNNTAAECDRYGYLFEVPHGQTFQVQQPDGSFKENVAVENLPFISFANNEAHGMMMYGFSGDGEAAAKDPFVIRGQKSWQLRYGLKAIGNYTYVEDLNLWDSSYGFYGTAAKNVKLVGMKGKTISQVSLEFYEKPEGLHTFENLVLDDLSQYPFRITGRDARTEPCEIHVRNYTLTNVEGNRNGAGSETDHAEANPEITLYLHDFFGPNRDAKVIPANQTRSDGLNYQTMTPTFEEFVKVAEVNVPFPNNPIQATDKLGPVTVITYPPADQTLRSSNGELTVYGSCVDASKVASLAVNGVKVKALAPNFSQWQVRLTNLPGGAVTLKTEAVDEFGNRELNPHLLKFNVDRSTAVEDLQASNTPVREYSLEQNYPNPFNPSTNIVFSIPQDEQGSREVRLIVFDVMGRQVRELVNERRAPGKYLQAWDGRNDAGELVGSGMYFYRLTAAGKVGGGDFTMTRKMVLSR